METIQINKITNKFTLCWFIYILSTAPATSFAQFNIQEIIQSTDTIQDLDKKTSSLLFLAEYFMQEQPDSAINFANQALEISKANNDSIRVSDAYKCLGVSYAEKMECSVSEEFFFLGLQSVTEAKDSAGLYADMGTAYIICGDLQKAKNAQAIAREIYTRISDQGNLARLITNIGLLHARNAKYYKAFECYLEALEICEELNDEETIAGIYQNMGEVMALQNQYDKAVGYYNSALYIFEKLERFYSMSGIYLNLGQIFIEQKQWDVAKHYLNKSYVIDTTYNLKNFESVALQLLGITYLRINKLGSAEKLVEEAVRIQNEKGYFTLASESKTILAEVYYEQGRYPKALNLLESAEIQAKENNDDNLLVRILSLKALILSSLKQFEEAYFVLKQSKSMEDSIFNIEKANSIMNLELAFQTEKKEKQIDELKFNDSLRNEQLKKRTAQVYLLIVSVILIIVLTISFFLFWQRRHQLENQKRERHFLQGRFEAEEHAKDKIARELHDDIGGQLTGLILQLQSSKDFTKFDLQQLQNVYHNVRRLSHSLDEPLFVGLTLQEKVRNYLSELKHSVSFKSNFIDDFSEDWEKIEDNQELQRNIYRIVQELTTNTIKYAGATTVEIQLLQESNTFILIYEDNGVGMTSEKIENNDGFNTIHKRVDMFGGACEITSSQGEGVFVKISMPYKYIRK